MNQVPLSKLPAASSHPGISVHPPAKPSGIPLTQTAPATHRIVETFKGTINNHVIDVIDKSGDKTQYYAFMAHCQTCAWDSRQHTLATATAVAKMHVGL